MASEHPSLPAGSRALNVSPFGVHDLAGNVSEWCADQVDVGSGSRACRGGSFRGTDVDDFDVTLRNALAENEQRDDLGFRCVVP